MLYVAHLLRLGVLIAGLAFTTLPALATSEQVVHALLKGQGSSPTGDLVQLGGILYGVTAQGGNGTACRGGCGTIFMVSTTGSYKIIHSFKSGVDGSYPSAGLLAYNGVLYGTAYEGGANGGGVLFSITPNGTFSVLHSFVANTADGDGPGSSLAIIDGTIYGTTLLGGTSDRGTIYSVNPTGNYNQIYQFGSSSYDGATPYGGLISYNGTIYGTTFAGGSNNDGTIYSITPAGLENVVYSFKGGSDGYWPITGLTSFQGKLYGTTYSGGAYTAGTIFSLGPDLSLTTIYTFRGKKHGDGSQPKAALVVLGNTLYGSTAYGGQGSCRNGGCGTVYSLAADNTYSLLYAFAGLPDAEDPQGALVAKNGILYGSAGGGSGGEGGRGTIYSITP